MVEIHSGKVILIALISLLALISIAGISSAYDKISEVANSGILSDASLQGLQQFTNNIDKIYYQKFTTGADTLSIRQIQLWLPANVTSMGLGEHRYLRIGIAKSTNGVLDYTPAQWYALGTLTNGFKCYADKWDYNNKGGFKNITIYLPSYPSSMYLEPNSNYYIAWYVWGDYQWLIPSFTAWMPRGFGPGVFGPTTMHRGNVTSASWTDAYSKYQLGYTLWGTKTSAELNGGVTLVDRYNASIYEIVNSGSAHGRVWTWGVWLKGSLPTAAAPGRNVTFYTNSSTSSKHYTFTDLTPGSMYYVRPWLLKNSSYSVTTGTALTFMTNPGDVKNFINTSTRDIGGNLALSWTKGKANDTQANNTVIFASLDGYVSDPYTNSSARYNVTGSTTTISLGGAPYYLTAYAYTWNAALGIEKYSLNASFLYNLPGPIGYQVNISNEKTPWGRIGNDVYWKGHISSIEFTDKDGNPVWLSTNFGGSSNAYCGEMNVTATGAYLCTFRWNQDGANGTVIERNHIIDQSPSGRFFTIYVPLVTVGTSKGNSKPVSIFLRDRTGGKYTLDQYPQIFIYANGEKNYASKTARDIHSDYVQADYAVRTYLVIGDQYAFYGKSDSMNMTRLGSLIIFDDSYTVDVTTTDVQNVSWTSYIKITTGYTSNTNLWAWANINDSTSGLNTVAIKLYNSNGTLLDSHTLHGSECWSAPPSGFSYKYNTGLANTSKRDQLYYGQFTMTYSKGTTQWTSMAYVFWSPEESGSIVNMSKLDELFNATIGHSLVYIPAEGGNPEIVIPYSTLILAGIVVMFFFLFRPENAAFAVFLIAAVLGVSRVIGLVTESIMPVASIAIIALLGALLYVIFKGDAEIIQGRPAPREYREKLVEKSKEAASWAQVRWRSKK